MRRALMVLLISLVACSPEPDPSSRDPERSALPTGQAPTASLAATAASRAPTPAPTVLQATTFDFDVENRSRVGVVVSVASDTAATMSGFEPGQRGAISILLLDPTNGIAVEVQGAECRLLAEGMFPTPLPFTLLVEDGAQAGTIRISRLAGALRTPTPLPSNSLVGCGG